MASEVETAAMHEAVLAAHEPAHTHPNPRVGCVLLTAAGVRLASGVHRGAGTPHAEVEALTRAGAAARGATAVVTLEPCAHTGRTSPCAAALVDAGVRRVVYAQQDPNPQAAGGSAHLREAGLEVEVLPFPEAEALNEHWTQAVRRGRPFVTWKLAASLDGRSAAADGTSRWISSAVSRADTHRLRARADAIAVGTGTVLVDDPRLSVRDADDRAVGHQPLRVVIGTREVPADRAVWNDEAATVQMPTRDVDAVLQRLFADGVRDLWLEGGPTLAGAFLDADAVDEVVAYIAPVLLGSGPSALSSDAVATIADAWRLAPYDITALGPDVRVTARPHQKENA